MLEFFKIFYSRAVIQRTVVESHTLLEHGFAEKIAVCAHTNHVLNNQGLDSFLYEAAQIFEVSSNIQNENKKIKKTYSS
jgi:hypothetical protein